jgi:YD repeat-containing protein
MARSGFVVSPSSPVRSTCNSSPLFSRSARAITLTLLLHTFPKSLTLAALVLSVVFSFTLNNAEGQTVTGGVQATEATNGEVSLDNLNVHLDIPLVTKQGVGLPFSWALHFNSNLWTPNTTTHAWTGKGFGWVWYLRIAGFAGIWDNANPYYCASQKTFYPLYVGFIDYMGNEHYLKNGNGVVLNTTGYCGGVSSYSALLNDGSGITVNLNLATSTFTATYADGTVYNEGTVTDVNGNKLSLTSDPNSPYTYTRVDTLGVTELTMTPGVECSSGSLSETYSYPTSTSAGTATITINCTEYSIATDFGCPNLTEASGGTQYLPTSISLPDGSSYSFTYESQISGSVTGRIASITYPNGAMVSYAYTGPNNGVNCADGSTAGLTRTAPDGVYTYTRNTTTWLSTTLVGPAPAGNTTVYTFIQQSAAPNAIFLSQSVENQGSSTPLRTKLFCYNGNQTSCATATAPGLPLTQTDVYTTLAGMTTSTRVSTTFDSYSNITKVALYDFGASTPTRQTVAGPYGYTWNGSTTSPNCTTAIGSGVNNKPCQSQLLNGSGTQLRNSYFQYGTTTNPGSLLSKAVLTGSSTYLTTSATYNTNGTVATSTDANGNVTTYTQGSCGGPTKVVPAISTLDTQYTWDTGCNGAKVLSAIDPNGFSVSETYNDPFWRPTTATDQLNNTVTLSYYPTVALNTNEAQMTFGSSDFDAFNTADLLGRPLLAQKIEGSGGSWDTTEMGYSWNATGRVTTRTMPCATSKSSGCSNGTTTITHDALGRPLVKTDGGGGTVTYTYPEQDILTVIGPAPAGEVVKQVQKEYNGLGQLMSVCQLSSATGTTSCGQANGGTGYVTTYNYNADGTVSSVVRGSQTHSFTYDALGRTLTATYPESGTKYFYYDSAPSMPGVACSTTALPTGTGLNVSPLSHLVKTYDANGTTTCFSYDKMNRNTGIAYAGTNWDGENKYFTYDSATVDSATMVNTLGRVAEAYTAPTSAGTKATDEGFSYTARGELSDVYQSTPNSNGYYHTTATYFANHALNTLSGVPGASGSPWTYSLDGKGRPYSTIESPSSNMVSSTTYNLTYAQNWALRGIAC